MPLEIMPDGLGGRCRLDAAASLAAHRRAERLAFVLAVATLPIVAGIVAFGFAAFVEWLPVPARQTTAADGLAQIFLPGMVACALAFGVPGVLLRGPLAPRDPCLELRWDATTLHVSGPRPTTLDLCTLRVELAQGVSLADAQGRCDLPGAVLSPLDQEHLSQALESARESARQRHGDGRAPGAIVRLAGAPHGTRQPVPRR